MLQLWLIGNTYLKVLLRCSSQRTSYLAGQWCRSWVPEKATAQVPGRPSLIQTRAVSFPSSFCAFFIGHRAPENLGFAAEMFFLDIVAGGVNNEVLETLKSLPVELWSPRAYPSEKAFCGHVCTGRGGQGNSPGAEWMAPSLFPKTEKRWWG